MTTTTRIHGWTVELFADVDEGGGLDGFTIEEIEDMNTSLERELKAALDGVTDDREAAQEIKRIKDQIVERYN